MSRWDRLMARLAFTQTRWWNAGCFGWNLGAVVGLLASRRVRSWPMLGLALGFLGFACLHALIYNKARK